MSRALITIHGDRDRERAIALVSKVPTGTRVEVKARKRSVPQNDRMWAMLTDVARQREHCGRKFTPDQWKVIFMHAIGKEVEFLPALDGRDFIPTGFHSSDLAKAEMSDLLEFIAAWGAENGIEFNEPE
jgi:hypothetical protein